LPDYRGLAGIESSFDEALRGKAGAKSVLVDNLGYRQSETVLTPIEPGKNVTLTIDATIQAVAEKELANAPGAARPTRGAAVVLDVRTGESSRSRPLPRLIRMIGFPFCLTRRGTPTQMKTSLRSKTEPCMETIFPARHSKSSCLSPDSKRAFWTQTLSSVSLRTR
jgi:hypothetical protein